MDFGLLSGIGEGLKTGLESYRQERDYLGKKKAEIEERKQKGLLTDLALKEKGYETNPQGTGVLKSEEGKRKEQFENLTKVAPFLAHGVSVHENGQPDLTQTKPTVKAEGLLNGTAYQN